MDDDPESCLASNSNDHIQEISEVDGGVSSALGMVDVSYRFHIFFLIGFYLSVIQIVVACVTQVLDNYDMNRLLYQIYNFSNLVFLCDWIYGFYIRFTPSGVACCGTFDEKFKDGTMY